MKTTTTTHTKDSDCTIGEDLCCTVCGVSHGAPCYECEQTGFHADDCSQLDHCCDDDCRSNGCSERFK
jgi:hypothetical protein